MQLMCVFVYVHDHVCAADPCVLLKADCALLCSSGMKHPSLNPHQTLEEEGGNLQGSLAATR